MDTMTKTDLPYFLQVVREWADAMCVLNADACSQAIQQGITHPIGWRAEYNAYRRRSDGKLFRMWRGEERAGFYSVKDMTCREDTGEFIPIPTTADARRQFEAEYERSGPSKPWAWTPPFGSTPYGTINGNVIEDTLRHFRSRLVGHAWATWLQDNPDKILEWLQTYVPLQDDWVLRRFMTAVTPAVTPDDLPDCGRISGTFQNLACAHHGLPEQSFAY